MKFSSFNFISVFLFCLIIFNNSSKNDRMIIVSNEKSISSKLKKQNDKFENKIDLTI